MTRDIDNTQDILDGRDVLKRFEELDSERADLEAAVNDAENDEDRAAAKDAFDEWPDADEWQALKDFTDDANSEWWHGETLIRESYFEDYARALAEDIGALKDCDHWPANCIDWEHAARELMQDYYSADFDGVTYYFRA